MKNTKNKFFVYSMLVMVLLALLSGCSNREKIINKENYEVKNINFKGQEGGFWDDEKDVAKVETKDSYYLLDLNWDDIEFKKANNSNTELQIIHKQDKVNKEIKTSYVLLISNKDLKSYSEMYIDAFDDNIPIDGN